MLVSGRVVQIVQPPPSPPFRCLFVFGWHHRCEGYMCSKAAFDGTPVITVSYLWREKWVVASGKSNIAIVAIGCNIWKHLLQTGLFFQFADCHRIFSPENCWNNIHLGRSGASTPRIASRKMCFGWIRLSVNTYLWCGVIWVDLLVASHLRPQFHMVVSPADLFAFQLQGRYYFFLDLPHLEPPIHLFKHLQTNSTSSPFKNS